MSPGPDAAPHYSTAPRWRREPYRAFFALGLLQAWAGVSPWFFLALGLTDVDRRPYHSIAQIQGFLICFAVGFLFTMIPRRTDTAAPGSVEMGIGLVCPIGTTIFAAFGIFAMSQVCWFALVGMLGNFLVRRMRFRGSSRAPLPGLIWVPIAFLMGLIGSLCFAIFGMTGGQAHALHAYGKLFLLQGMFLGLVLGVGGLVFPLFTPEGSPGPSRYRDRLGVYPHLLTTLVLIVSFVVEVEGHPVEAYGMRGGLLLAVLLSVAWIHRLPRLRGANRWFAWGTAWMLPLGYGLAAGFPSQAMAGLHVVFIAGFASMAFTVGMHVSLAQDGGEPSVGRWPWPIISFAFLFLVATVSRALMNFDDVSRYYLWMGIASGSFLGGTMLWAILALPSMLRVREPG